MSEYRAVVYYARVCVYVVGPKVLCVWKESWRAAM